MGRHVWLAGHSLVAWQGSSQKKVVWSGGCATQTKPGSQSFTFSQGWSRPIGVVGRGEHTPCGSSVIHTHVSGAGQSLTNASQDRAQRFWTSPLVQTSPAAHARPVAQQGSSS